MLMSRAVFPGSEGRTRSQAVREFLAYTREGLAEEVVQVTADVFGITTAFRRDVGIGQVWESFIDQVDAAREPLRYANARAAISSQSRCPSTRWAVPPPSARAVTDSLRVDWLPVVYVLTLVFAMPSPLLLAQTVIL